MNILTCAGLTLRELLRGPVPLLLGAALILMTGLLLALPSGTAIEDARLGSSIVLTTARLLTILGVAVIIAGGIAHDVADRTLAPFLATPTPRAVILLARLLAGLLMVLLIAALSHGLAGLLLVQLYGSALTESKIGQPDRILEARRFERAAPLSGEPKLWLRGGDGRRAIWTFALDQESNSRDGLPVRFSLNGFFGLPRPGIPAPAERTDYAPCELRYRALNEAGQVTARRSRAVLVSRNTFTEEVLPEPFARATRLEVELCPRDSGVFLNARAGGVCLVARGAESFSSNLLRNALTTSLVGALMTAVAVGAGLAFPAGLAILFTLVLYLGGLARPSIAVFARSLDTAPVARAPLATESLESRGPGPFVRAYLRVFVTLLPDVQELETNALVLRGETIPWSRLGRALPHTLIYSGIVILLSLLALRGKELGA